MTSTTDPAPIVPMTQGDRFAILDGASRIGPGWHVAFIGLTHIAPLAEGPPPPTTNDIGASAALVFPPGADRTSPEGAFMLARCPALEGRFVFVELAEREPDTFATAADAMTWLWVAHRCEPRVAEKMPRGWRQRGREAA